MFSEFYVQNNKSRPNTIINPEEVKPYTSKGVLFKTAAQDQWNLSLFSSLISESKMADDVNQLYRDYPELETEYSKYLQGIMVKEEPKNNEKYKDNFAENFKLSFVDGDINNILSKEEFLNRVEGQTKTLEQLKEDKRFSFATESSLAQDTKISEIRAKEYQKKYEQKKTNEAIINNAKPGFSSAVASFSGSLSGAMADPVNLIPTGRAVAAVRNTRSVVKALTVANKAKTLGIKAKAVGKTAGLAGLEGAYGAALSDGLIFPQANKWGANLTAQDFAADVMLSGILGSFIGSVGGVIGVRKATRMHIDAITLAKAQLEEGLPIDVTKVLPSELFENKMPNEPDYYQIIRDRALNDETRPNNYKPIKDIEDSNITVLLKEAEDEAINFLNNEPSQILVKRINELGKINEKDLLDLGFNENLINKINNKTNKIITKDGNLKLQDVLDEFKYENINDFIDDFNKYTQPEEYIKNFKTQKKAEYINNLNEERLNNLKNEQAVKELEGFNTQLKNPKEIGIKQASEIAKIENNFLNEAYIEIDKLENDFLNLQKNDAILLEHIDEYNNSNVKIENTQKRSLAWKEAALCVVESMKGIV